MELFQFALIYIFLLICIGFGLAFFFLYQRQRSLERSRKDRVDTISRLIEKFSTAKEFIEFLRSVEGKQFIEDPVAPLKNPLFRVLRFMRLGIVSIFFSVGFFLNAFRLRGETDPNYVHQVMDMQSLGLFSLVLGVGLLVVAFVTRVFIKKWRLDSNANGGIS